MLHDICDHGSQPVCHPAGGPCQEGGLSLPRLRAPRPAMNAGIGGLISPRRGQQAGYTESLVHIREAGAGGARPSAVSAVHPPRGERTGEQEVSSN